jgi:hypothetical protein
MSSEQASSFACELWSFAMYVDLNLSLVLFVITFALTCVLLFALSSMRRPERQPAMHRVSPWGRQERGRQGDVDF